MRVEIFFLVAVSLAAPAYKLVNKFAVPDPGFLSFAPAYPNSTSAALIISSFVGTGTDSVYSVPNLAQVSKGATASVTQLTTKIVWPNEATQPPEKAFAGVNDATVVVAGGFLVPGKETGAISVLDLSTDASIPIKLSVDKTNYFYHHTVWFDMNNDGLLDIVSARAIVPTIGSPSGELVWLQQPVSNPLQNTPWKESVIIGGPDVFFIMEDVDGDGVVEIVATQFFTSKLVIYWCGAASWSLCNSTNIKSQVIDSTVGPLFDVEYVDINNDGKKDLLVTNNLANGSGSVYVYEVPANFKTQASVWARHLLVTGITPIHPKLQGQGSPGAAVAYYPYSNSTGKPLILVSGDDAGSALILTPTSQDVSNWSYSVDNVYQSTGTTGEIIVGDVDGDGAVEFFIPEYSESFILVYSYGQ